MALRVDDDRWLAIGLEALAERALRGALDRADIGRRHEVSLLATDDAAVAALNHEFRGKPVPTNVLSWPAEALATGRPGARPRPPALDELGDIALAYETCAREAASSGIPLRDHATHLIVHGLFHLLGYDHENDADASLMEGLESETLAQLGIPDPYCRDGPTD